jgi:hypothetical protein
MSHSFKRSALGIAAAVAAVGAASMFVAPSSSQTPGFRASRFVDGNPDLSGFWQAVGAAHWDIEAHHAQPGPSQFGALFSVPAGLGVVEGGDIPYQPWAAQKRQQNFEKRWSLDPEAKCYMPGVPRATYMPFPFQIIQSTSKIMMVYEYATTQRTIHMNQVKASPVDTWMGHSIGRWDGDTLVVDVTSFNDATWFDRAGNFHSDALHVVERYTPKTPHHLEYEVTIEDPKVFTRQWKMRMPLYRRQEADVQLLEFRCVPFADELLYGDLRAPAAGAPAAR